MLKAPATIAIAGVTGAVGQEFCRLLESRPWAGQVRMLASARSAGKTVHFRGEPHTIHELSDHALNGCQLALFSAGSAITRRFAPAAKAAGCVLIDNSSAFRMDPAVPLVIPEVNPHAAHGQHPIIANPNCSTIIMAVPVWPLHQAFIVRRILVSTYQAVSGAGWQAMQELQTQTADVLAGRQPSPQILPHPIAFNVFSHNTDIGPDGYNIEETKMRKETHKIFANPAIGISATCIRVPVLRSHAEAITLEFAQPVTPDQAREVLAAAPGVRLVDNPAKNHFPMPIEASGQGDILVGRIRSDTSLPDARGLSLFVCGDQLLKGAALNAVQIADLLFQH